MKNEDYRKSHLGKIAKKYEFETYQKNSYYSLMWEIEKKYLKEFLRKHKIKNYLDFACGGGRVIKLVENYVDNSLGVDVSEDMLKIAEERVKKSKLLLQDITQIGLKERFDLITAFRFFLNAQTELKHNVLMEFQKITEKDSFIIVSNQGNKYSFRSFIFLINKYLCRNKINQMSKNDLEKLFKRYDFRLVEYKGIGFLPKELYKIPFIKKTLFNIDLLFYKLRILSYFSKNQIFVFKKTIKMDNYLKLKGRKYLVRNDLESFLIFYNYFLSRINKIPDFLYKPINQISILVIKIFFRLKLNNFLKTIKINENFLIRIKSKWKNPSIIKLIKKNKRYYIRKYNCPATLRKEMNFYKKYSKNISKIKPQKRTLKENYLEYDFIKCKNLQTLLIEGNIKKCGLRKFIDEFVTQLNLFYGNKNKCLIHGDLTPNNIYYMSGIFTIVDYSESEFYYPDFDKYTFIEQVFKHCKISKKELERYFNIEKINQFEKHLKRKNEIRYQKQTI